ncbi:MAG: hypothetical protein JSC188_000425 [Candidatus Tokpelaia sp. JSC188]|nr:MAG: hypothetical protein JSC188_000425 [Candidatus Tokpelaia sp. JSC188]
MSKYDLTHARHDPSHCLCPGLFQSLKRGDRKRGKLDVTYDYGQGESVRFVGFEPLGADDLRVLQGLVAMASVSGEQGRGLLLSSEPKTEAGQKLRSLLELKWDAIYRDAMVAKGSFRQLAWEIGYKKFGGEQLKAIRISIERLWTVSVIVIRGRNREGFRILSGYRSDDLSGQFFVAINPRLAAAVLGRRPYACINMSEVRALQTDPARLIHQRLCGWIDPGKAGRVELDTICGYVWHNKVTNVKAITKRRQTARKAISALVTIGWTVNEYAKGKWKISRP